jgi:hypothetical protein
MTSTKTISELVLREVRDTDRGGVALDAQPLVVLGVF